MQARKRIFAASFVIAYAILACLQAVRAEDWVTGEPMPFKAEPESFAKWLSKQTFKGRTHSGEGKYEFFQLSGCSLGAVLGPNAITRGSVVIYDPDDRRNPYRYRCDIGYLKESTPLGSKICRIKWLEHVSPHQLTGAARVERESTTFSWDECRWLTGPKDNNPSPTK